MKPPWRILLPVGHLAVDCFVLALWLWQAGTLYAPKADSFRPRIAQVVLFQEAPSIAFDPIFLPPPDELVFLATGNMPAMIVSSTVRPRGMVPTRAKVWDPVWFSIHEIVSSLVWSAIGALLDLGLLRLRNLMMVFLAARFLFAALLLVRHVADAAWRLQTISWFLFGVFGIVVGFRWMFAKLNAHWAKPHL